mmetsp:Transcript_24240/g.67150  ORF Transcript_24240/g.67150 Transcript_24240/m.67150 type:complete len:410 (+) Transcript_24240:124-1353(+)
MAPSDQWYLYVLIPIIDGAVGYFTNVLALQMTFAPLEFVGIPIIRFEEQPFGLFGWQGIIPAKARKMATIAFDLMTTKLVDIQEVFNRIDPVQFAKAMDDALLLLMDKVINEVAMETMPQVWGGIPQAVKDDIIVTADSESGQFLREFMKDMQRHIYDVVDIKEMCVNACVQNKHLIVQIFKECGDKEFAFIRQSGFYFGAMFGVIHMVIFMFYKANWVMPVFGFLVGTATNWLALKVIFSPTQPRTFLGITFHGIFMRRQREVSAIFARVICVEILHIKAIWNAVFQGSRMTNFTAMLRAHTLVFTDKLVVEVEPLAVAAMGSERFLQMKEDIARKVTEKIPDVIDSSYEYTQKALDMENTIRVKMAALPPEEFERVLHPAFEEDEIQLIILGGLLGAIVGALQLLMF